jgi:hypothetical protein
MLILRMVLRSMLRISVFLGSQTAIINIPHWIMASDLFLISIHAKLLANAQGKQRKTPG